MVRGVAGVRSRQMFVLVSALMLVLAAAAPGVAASTEVFDAQFTGTFTLEDVGGSNQFRVFESGDGSETEVGFGSFTYEAEVLQNLDRRPEGCGPNSSTGKQGSATLTFSDGDLRLKRTYGEACFAFPFVDANERWAVASGSGAYRGTTGALVRTWDGDVRFGTATGSWTGEVRLP